MLYGFKGPSGCLVQTGGHRQNQATQVEGDQTHPERERVTVWTRVEVVEVAGSKKRLEIL